MTDDDRAKRPDVDDDLEAAANILSAQPIEPVRYRGVTLERMDGAIPHYRVLSGDHSEVLDFLRLDVIASARTLRQLIDRARLSQQGDGEEENDRPDECLGVR